MKSFVDITGVGLMHFTSLTKLNLNYCQKITDEGMGRLESLVALKNLNLAYCVKIKGVGLGTLTSH